jgi:hypothetical protein
LVRSNGRGRRAFCGALLALSLGLWARDAATQSVAVPLRLQAELLSKVAGYDRGFPARAHGKALVFVLVKSADTESVRTGKQFHAELGALPQIGGLPHNEEIVDYRSARALAELCKQRGAAVVYISVGLADEMEGIASALDGVSILSVAAAASYVTKRSVLGFDAESGHPKLVVHLDQARRQKVAFKAELLKLARVIK